MTEEILTLQGLNQKFDELMDFLVENMATKDDLKQFATKDDLGAMEERMEKRFDSKLDLLKNDLMQEIRAVRQEWLEKKVKQLSPA